MVDMPHWNAFVKEMLKRQQDKPDSDRKAERATAANNLTSKKRAKKEDKNE